MIIRILGLILSFLGVALVFLEVRHKTKYTIDIEIKDTIVLEKYIKIQKVLGLIVGFSYTIMGLLLALNMIPGEYVLLIVCGSGFLDVIIRHRFNKFIKE